MNNAQNTNQNNDDDINLFSQAFKSACELYEPLGFVPVGHGKLYHMALGIPLLPFFERIDESPNYYESPMHHALRSAYRSGRSDAINESQKTMP